jgi:hypothetical protein
MNILGWQILGYVLVIIGTAISGVATYISYQDNEKRISPPALYKSTKQEELLTKLKQFTKLSKNPRDVIFKHKEIIQFLNSNKFNTSHLKYFKLLEENSRNYDEPLGIRESIIKAYFLNFPEEYFSDKFLVNSLLANCLPISISLAPISMAVEKFLVKAP